MVWPMFEHLRSALLWLSTVDPALPRALLVAAVFLTVYVLRKLFPRTWEFFAGAVPVSVIDPAPLLLVLSKAWQALPAMVIGGVATALTTGGDVRASVKGALFGALAALAHELAKAAPWLPYRGEVGKLRTPTLPVLVLFVSAALASTWPYVTGCAGSPKMADHPDPSCSDDAYGVLVAACAANAAGCVAKGGPEEGCGTVCDADADAWSNRCQ